MNNKDCIEKIGKQVFHNEGYNEWSLRWSIDNECIKDLKIIHLDKSLLNSPVYYIFEILMHEVAHIRFDDDNYNHYAEHDAAFYKEYGRLLMEYANTMYDLCFVMQCPCCGVTEGEFHSIDCEYANNKRVQYFHNPIRCSRCGVLNPDMKMYDDETWATICGDEYSVDDILCIECMNFIIEKRKEKNAW